MNLTPYEKRLPVKLTPEEIEDRRRAHSLAPLGLEAHAEVVAEEAEKWDAAKAARKAREKELEGQGKKMIADLCKEARVIRDGVDMREVLCEDVVVGQMLHTRRLDTGEQVGPGRRASPLELEAWEEAHPPVITGSIKASADVVAPGNGHEPTGIAESLDKALPGICTKARNEALVYKALGQAVPTSTPLDRKACVERNLKAGNLGEKDGKLLWAPNEGKAAEDDAVVPDDYQPGATH